MVALIAFQGFYFFKGALREFYLIGTVILTLAYVLDILHYYRFKKKGVEPTPLQQPIRRRLYTLWSIIAVVQVVEAYAIITHFLMVYEALALIATQALIAALYTWWVMRGKK